AANALRRNSWAWKPSRSGNACQRASTRSSSCFTSGPPRCSWAIGSSISCAEPSAIWPCSIVALPEMRARNLRSASIGCRDSSTLTTAPPPRRLAGAGLAGAARLVVVAARLVAVAARLVVVAARLVVAAARLVAVAARLVVVAARLARFAVARERGAVRTRAMASDATMAQLTQMRRRSGYARRMRILVLGAGIAALAAACGEA